MTIIKSPSAKGRTHSELPNLKFQIWFLFLFGRAFAPHKVKLGKLPTYFAKQTQFQNPPVNTNPCFAGSYKNQTPNRTSKQTQTKPSGGASNVVHRNTNPIKANLPPLTPQKSQTNPIKPKPDPISNSSSSAPNVVQRPISPLINNTHTKKPSAFGRYTKLKQLNILRKAKKCEKI